MQSFKSLLADTQNFGRTDGRTRTDARTRVTLNAPPPLLEWWGHKLDNI